MSSKSSIYKGILKSYDQMRMEALVKRERFRRELYDQIPRIEEIDNELSMLGFGLTKAVLENPTQMDEKMEELKTKQRILKEEKESILDENHYPKDCLEVQYACKLCEDTGYIGNEKCSCFTQKLIDAVYNQSNLKQVLKNENFNHFNSNLYSSDITAGEVFSPRENIQRILTAVLHYTRNFNQQKGNLFLYGKTGLGKTYMCNCIAKELLDQGITVMYVTAPQLFREMEKERFGQGEEFSEEDSYLENILTVELLIIDDLGTEFDTVFTTSQLYNVISTRLTNRLATIISTNLAMKDLSEKYSDRITSRLIGDFTTLKFIGEDIRSMKKFKEKNKTVNF